MLQNQLNESMKTLLLTGFEPFGGEHVNPSQVVVEGISTMSFANVNVITAILPVSRFAATQALSATIAQCKPDVVMMLGEAGTRTRISPERVAINLDDFRIPDNGGHQPQNEPIVPDGPAAYFTTLPIHKLVASMIAADIPAGISNSAGTYLCNRVFYWVMHLIHSQNLPIQAGFIHLPYLHEQSLNKRDCPSLARATQIEAIRLAILACVA
jgi:pyroglutamyl-peptidase